MNDQSSPDIVKKRFRSPPYPMFDLSKAIERVSLLYGHAQGHSVGANVLAEAWGMKPGDGKVWRAAAALIQYGLLSDSGTGKTRKFQIADNARRLVLDVNPDSVRRKEALKTAALSPMIHNELWQKFGTTIDLADSVVKTYLTLDREEAGEAPYSPAAAEEVLSTYRQSIAFAGLVDSDTVSTVEAVKEPDSAANGIQKPEIKIVVGDWVKWVSGGIDQFDGRKVNWISEDGSHLRVIGSMTGIPMNEVEKVEAPSAIPSVAPPAHIQNENDVHEEKSGGAPNKSEQATGKVQNVSTSIVGGRLQLSADVSADEIPALINMLSKYEEILKMMN